MMTGRDQLAAAHGRMTADEIAAHALKLAGELEALARMVTSQNALVRSLATIVRSQSASIRAINAMHRAGKKREAREALATAAAVPDLEPVPVADFTPDWSTAMFRPAEALEARH